MSLTVAVGGANQLDALAKRLKDAGRKDLSRQLDKAVRKAPRHVEEAVRNDVPIYMPKGYEAVFRASLTFTTAVSKSGGHRVTIRVRALGAKGHDRQVQALERGSLRHPVYARGRRSTWTWVAQRVKPRFFTEPALSARHAVRSDIEQAMHDVAVKIEKG